VSKETLTESMRRLSNIVNEAEQVNELDILTNPRKAMKGAAERVGGVFGRILARHFRAADQRRVANSPVRQLENIEYLANSFARELGDDPDQWVGKIRDYFADIHTTTKQIVVDKSAAFDHGVGQKLGTDERVKKIMGQFNLEFEELVENTARYAQDRYSIDPKTLYSRTKKRILENIRREVPSARSSSANHLEAVYKELMLDKEATLLPSRVKRYLAMLMVLLGILVYAEANKDKFDAEQEERLRNNPDIHYRYPDTPSADAPNPFDGGTNTTPRRWSGSRVYFGAPDSD